MNFVSHMSQWYGNMFSWGISDNSSLVFCFMNLQSKMFWNELCITYVRIVWNNVFLKNFWWIKSCFLFEPSKLAVKMKFSMYGLLFFWRMFHIIVGCVIRCLFWQLTSEIDKIEDKTSIEHLALSNIFSPNISFRKYREWGNWRWIPAPFPHPSRIVIPSLSRPLPIPGWGLIKIISLLG